MWSRAYAQKAPAGMVMRSLFRAAGGRIMTKHQRAQQWGDLCLHFCRGRRRRCLACDREPSIELNTSPLVRPLFIIIQGATALQSWITPDRAGEVRVSPRCDEKGRSQGYSMLPSSSEAQELPRRARLLDRVCGCSRPREARLTAAATACAESPFPLRTVLQGWRTVP